MMGTRSLIAESQFQIRTSGGLVGLTAWVCALSKVIAVATWALSTASSSKHALKLRTQKTQTTKMEMMIPEAKLFRQP
jgi:hypothetical protein